MFAHCSSPRLRIEAFRVILRDYARESEVEKEGSQNCIAKAIVVQVQGVDVQTHMLYSTVHP